MAKIKLRATLTAVLEYEVEERFAGAETIADLCRDEEKHIREDPTDFCDSGRVKFTAKVERVRTGGPEDEKT